MARPHDAEKPLRHLKQDAKNRNQSLGAQIQRKVRHLKDQNPESDLDGLRMNLEITLQIVQARDPPAKKQS